MYLICSGQSYQLKEKRYIKLELQNMNITIWLIVLVFLLDFAVIWNIIQSKHTRRHKVLSALVVILFPIIGVSIYHLVAIKCKKINHYKTHEL
ncbi:hypothetical protein DW103_17030 [Parabacteroides sp. AM08-6]|nr:hypothetical protein DW103_17030 [Parabacteroides sp. AM08-6]